MPRLALIAASVLAMSHAVVGGNVTISNILPRRDTTGAIIDAHDGNVLFDSASGQYLYYAAGYGSCQEPPGLNGCASWCDGWWVSGTHYA